MPVTSSSAFLLSSFIGAFLGMSTQVLIGVAMDPYANFSDVWIAPGLMAIYGLISLPCVMFGLAVFGLPVTYLLRFFAMAPWIGVVAILWGGLSGKLLFVAVDRLLLFGQYDPTELRLNDVGMIFGSITGFTWWLLRRTSLGESHLDVSD